MKNVKLFLVAFAMLCFIVFYACKPGGEEAIEEETTEEVVEEELVEEVVEEELIVVEEEATEEELEEDTEKVITSLKNTERIIERMGFGNITFNAPLKFKMGPVYDMDQTEVIPGQEEKDPKAEMDRVESLWLGTNNTPTERTLSLRDLAVKSAATGKILKNQAINVGLGKDTGSSGGWSKGTEIEISNRSGGERELFTIMHELAHSVLHYAADKRKADLTREAAEIDAEGTAYVVMGHYGFSDNERAYNYLANWTKKNKNAKDFIMNRFEPILEAANAIIAGMEQQKMEDYGRVALASSWYKRVILASTYHNLLKEIQMSGEESYVKYSS